VIEAIAGAFLLVGAVAAMGAAALRVASLAAPGGLERVVAAAPLGVAGAVAWALALGAVGLGGSALALSFCALVTLLVAWWRLPRPAVSLSGELAAWLRGARFGVRLGLAASVGLWAGWVVWGLRYPYLGLDGGSYHLGAVADWVTGGHTGRSEDLYARIPVGSYPLTNEVALAWAVGIARSFAPVAAWTASIGALLAAGGWLGLRALAVPRGLAVLALASLCLVPVVLSGLVHVETDLPAVAWVVAAAALAVRSRERPRLLAPMVVAAALAIGTKTTVLPLAAIVVAAGLWAGRGGAVAGADAGGGPDVRAAAGGGAVRRHRRALLAALALGLVAGGLWYVRNLIAHGSPLWPFRAAPWGDPVPPLLDRVDFSLLQRPRATLEGQLPIYRAAISGGLVLLGGGLLAAAWARRRSVVVASALTLLAVLAWASAPYTGAGAAPFLQVNTIRYLIPAMAAGACALALSGRGGRRARGWAALLLGVALVWSLKRYLDDPYLPAEGLLAGASVLGALAVAGGLAVAVRARAGRALGVAGVLALALVLGLGGRHYVERHARARDFDSNVVGWFAGQPAWRSGEQPIAFSPAPVALLAGNRLRHPLSLVGVNEPCASVHARLTRGWVVVRDADRKLFGTLAAERCLAGERPVFDDGVHRVYGGGR
jgi:hypothetical protein